MEDSFIHLHVHSHYSLMWGVSSLEDICTEAAAKGFASLALTDTNGLYGLVHFLDVARERGIRPIVGAHLKTPSESALILAKTPTGFSMLSDLITRRHLQESFSLSSAMTAMPENLEHLALISSDPELLKSAGSRAECFMEITPGPSVRRAIETAKSLGVPPLATNAVYFVRPEDYALHRLIRAIGCNRTLSTLPPEEVVQPGQWLQSPEDIARRLPDCREALSNAGMLAGKCHTDWGCFRTVFPSYRDEQGDRSSLLAGKCREGISWRYGSSSDAVEMRLSEELDLIASKGYVDYFLVVADIVRRRPINCGRGSGAASLVSYLLGITHVDPIRHNLFFGRFLNPHRKDPPDIDVDFPWDERDGLLDEIRQCYGARRMAQVSNHVGFGARAAVREVAKVYGIPAGEIKEMARRLSSWTHPSGILKRMERHPKFHGFTLDPPWSEIIYWAGRLESIPRHLSTHCGGVILTPDRVSRYAPVERSRKGNLIIQWEKEQAERAGLVKIDLLGNRSLAVIRDALKAIEENTGRRIDYALFNPLDDPAALDLLARGDTMGIFYVESPAMRQLQKKTRRGDFEHIVIHSSIIRPAANRYIEEYIRRLGGAPYEPLHPCLKDILSETYGILVYQEQVVQVAMAMAGFSWSEADGLRKVISKKSVEQLSAYQAKFYEGCAHKGVSPDVASTVWEMFASFAGYSFCKPHSASYALVSFKSAYLKAHHPAEFMAAVISNGGGYYSASAYISEARRMGLTILGPDINASEWRYTGRGKAIRIGLQQLQGVRREALESILDERNQNGPFLSLDDFLQRTRMRPPEASILLKSGALDALARNLNRPQLLWAITSRLNRLPLHGGKAKEQPSLAFPSGRIPISVPPLPDFEPRQKWQQEAEALGFVLSVHPLAVFEPSIRGFSHRIISASDLGLHVGRKVWVAGWPIARKETLTKEREPMEFVSFEDETAAYETIFFPQAFQRFCRELDMNRAFLLYGQVECEYGAESLVIHRLHRIREGRSPS